MELDRRHFLKYAGATAGVVGATAVGLDYLLSLRSQSTSKLTISVTTSGLLPPTIGNFSWQPTRIVNDKVYDATAAFDVESTTPVTSLNATLEGYAPTIPPRAYPPENRVTLQLGPVRQSTSVTTYSAKVTDLKGGKHYKLSTQAKNSAGTQTEEFETPYVREFENIAGMDNVLVGASYHPWWENPCRGFCHWGELGADYSKGTTPLGTPLLGLYNSNDPSVISKHIDWATGYGIDSFWCSYNGSNVADERMAPIMANALVKDIKIALLYETAIALGGPNEDLSHVDLNDASTYSLLEYHFRSMASRYFSHPSYLKIDGRPVVYIYASSQIGGDISTPIRKLRESVRQIAGFDMYLIGDEMHLYESPKMNRLKPFDAITSYSHTNSAETRSQREYAVWQNAARSADIELIPPVSPGYDDRNLCKLGVRKGCSYAPKSPQGLAARLETALQFVGRDRMLMIVSWDEWAENSFVEPTVEDGFKYLQTLRNTLAGR